MNKKIEPGTKIKIDDCVRLPVAGSDDIIAEIGDVIEILQPGHNKNLGFSNGKMARMREQKERKLRERKMLTENEMKKKIRDAEKKEEQRKRFFERVKARKKEAQREPLEIITRSKKYKKFHEGTTKCGCAITENKN